jgi:hypothetical protein
MEPLRRSSAQVDPVKLRHRRTAGGRAQGSRAWWMYRRLTAFVRPLPDFLVLGAMKAGTTSTYAYLVRHPRIQRAWRKEVHFFEAPATYALGELWYRAHFPIRRSGMISGDATPSYMFFTEAPARIARHVPRARLITLLRNPVDRAFSHYHHLVQRGGECRTFEAALDQQLLELPAGPRDDAETYLARGLYAEQLESVLRVFPRDQLLVLVSAELFARPAETVARIFAFLGLPSCAIEVLKPRNRGQYPPMPATARARLVRFFRPHNKRLYDLLGRDLGWDR